MSFKCEASDATFKALNLTTRCPLHMQRNCPQIFSNIKIFANTADKSVSLTQVAAGQFQFGN